MASVNNGSYQPVSLSARNVNIKGSRVQSTSLIVQELSESRGGRPELSVLTSLLVSVDIKNY